MEYATKKKNGELVKVDSAFAVELIENGKKTAADFLFVTTKKNGEETTVTQEFANQLVADGRKDASEFPSLSTDYGVDNWIVDTSDTSDVDYSMISEPSDEDKQIATALFPRGVNAAERGANNFEQLAAGLGDSFSLPGRISSGLVGSVKRLIEGDTSAEEQVQAYLADIGNTHGTETQNGVVKFIEDIVRDPALIPSMITGGAVGGLGKAVNTIRGFKASGKLAKALPYLKRAAQGAVAGVTDVAAQDYMNDYAMDEDKIQLSDYALGGTVGAVMPFAADKSKALGDKLYKTMKGVKAVPVPQKQFSQFKPAEETFGIGSNDIGLNTESAKNFGEKMDGEYPGEYAGDLTSPLLDENRKLIPGIKILPSGKGTYINQPGSNELANKTLSDMLNEGPSKAIVDLMEKGEQKYASVMNKGVRGYNKVAEPVVNFDVDFANLVNRPIYGSYNLGKQGVAAGVRGLAMPLSDMLKKSAYRYPIDATILRDQFQDEERSK